MKRFSKSTFFLSLVFALSAVAGPMHLEAPEAHIIVTRPIDRWSPDSLQQDGAVMWIREFMPAFWETTPRPQVSLVWLNWSFFGDSFPMMRFVMANMDNKKLSDGEFRQVIRNTTAP